MLTFVQELKLLHEFDHPNVVHFVSNALSQQTSLMHSLQYGVSIPEDTRSSPVMIISELCPNGDLFDYIRNVPPPSLRRVVCVSTTLS